MRYIPLEQQIAAVRKINAALRYENVRLRGDLDYIAMMTDVDLGTDTVEEKEAEENEAQ